MNIAERLFTFDQWSNQEVKQFRSKFDQIRIQDLSSISILSTELSSVHGVTFVLISTDEQVFNKVTKLLNFNVTSLENISLNQNLGLEIGNQELVNEI